MRGAAANERAAAHTVKPETVLSVVDCHAYYGDFHVIKGVTLDVKKGETVAVVGESGSGKSTLARIVTGLLPPRSGRLLFRGQAMPATLKALKRAGLTLADIDYFELNEAFAAQACAVTKGLGADPAKVNPNGSGISLGHPIGATGALITVKAIHELQRIQGRYALVTMCIGGGQGIAAIFERL